MKNGHSKRIPMCDIQINITEAVIDYSIWFLKIRDHSLFILVLIKYAHSHYKSELKTQTILTVFHSYWMEQCY